MSTGFVSPRQETNEADDHRGGGGFRPEGREQFPVSLHDSFAAMCPLLIGGPPAVRLIVRLPYELGSYDVLQ